MLLHWTASTVASGSKVHPSSELRSRLFPPADQVPDSGSQIAVDDGNELPLSLPNSSRPSGNTQEEASPICVQPAGVAIGLQTSATQRGGGLGLHRVAQRLSLLRPRSNRTWETSDRRVSMIDRSQRPFTTGGRSCIVSAEEHAANGRDALYMIHASDSPRAPVR
jgi:hypothetical protein